MLRWPSIAVATAAALLTIAAVQGGPVFLQQVWTHTGLRLPNVGSVGTGGSSLATSQPFANAASPAWSQTDQLVNQLQEQLKQKPDDPLTATRYAQLGSLYLQKVRETGDPSYYAKAEAVLQQAIRSAPDNPAAMIGLASLALSRHDFAGGLEWGQRAAEKAPRSYVAYGIIGDAYTELGRYDEAVQALQQMVDLRPDQTSLSRVSYARELHGDLPGAIDAMDEAAGAGAPRSEGTAWTRVQLGHLYFLSGDLAKAELQYRFVVSILPDYVHGEAGLAKVAAARGDLKEAARLYTRVLNSMPWPEYAIALGEVQRALGNEPAARRTDDLVRVIAQLQRAAGVDVDLEMALFEADRATDPQARAEMVQRAQATYQRRPSVHAADVLAWTLYRAGKPAEALGYAREALRLGSKDPLLLFHAGAIAAAAGQPVEARGYLEAALATQPRFSVRYAPEAQQLLARVKQAGA